MAKRLYVGNLPLSMTQDALEQLVATKGEVLNIRLMSEPFSGQSRGFAFVEMRRDQDADKAIQELNGFKIEGRAIVVNEARPQVQWSRGGSGGSRGGPRPSGGGGSFRRRSF